MKNAVAWWLRHDCVPRAELLRLASLATGKSRESLLAHPDAALDTDAIARLERLIARRGAGEPMAYLLGRREFHGREFKVDARVLIPRPETELLVDLAIAWIARHAIARDDRPLSVLDLGTGSGVIAITLALECPSISVTATDVSTAALEVGVQNARGLGADVRLVAGDWMAPFRNGPDGGQQFDLIVSNPPYIAAADPHLAEGDLRHEPRNALTNDADDHDGLNAIRRIVADSASHLRPDGSLMLEHGYDQAAAVRRLLIESGYTEIASFRDLAGIERVTTGARDSIHEADRQ